MHLGTADAVSAFCRSSSLHEGVGTAQVLFVHRRRKEMRTEWGDRAGRMVYVELSRSLRLGAFSSTSCRRMRHIRPHEAGTLPGCHWESDDEIDVARKEGLRQCSVIDREGAENEASFSGAEGFSCVVFRLRTTCGVAVGFGDSDRCVDDHAGALKGDDGIDHTDVFVVQGTIGEGMASRRIRLFPIGWSARIYDEAVADREAQYPEWMRLGNVKTTGKVGSDECFRCACPTLACGAQGS